MRMMAILTAVMMLAGCNTAQTVRDDGPHPIPLQIEYRSLGKDRRYVYYRLERGGELYFGGGRDAGIREASPAGKLTEQQLTELWRVIENNDLMTAEGSGPFADHEKTRYEVKLRAGSKRHSFNAVDDEVPGLATLDQKLFDLQADLRYDTLFLSIDEKIRKEGGAVKKK